MAQETLPWQPILESKLAKIRLFAVIRSPGISKRIAITPFWF